MRNAPLAKEITRLESEIAKAEKQAWQCQLRRARAGESCGTGKREASQLRRNVEKTERAIPETGQIGNPWQAFSYIPATTLLLRRAQAPPNFPYP